MRVRKMSSNTGWELLHSIVSLPFVKLMLYNSPHWLHLATSEMWCRSGGRGISRKLSLCYSIMYYYNGAQRYEQFLQISRLCQALILLCLALCLPSCVSSVFMMLYTLSQKMAQVWLAIGLTYIHQFLNFCHMSSADIQKLTFPNTSLLLTLTLKWNDGNEALSSVHVTVTVLMGALCNHGF